MKLEIKHSRSEILLLIATVVIYNIAVPVLFVTDNEVVSFGKVLIGILIIPIAVLWIGDNYVIDEHGVSRRMYNKTLMELTWSECVLIGTYKIGMIGNGKELAFAKTPLRQRTSITVKVLLSLGIGEKPVEPTWKKKEAIKINYPRVGDENYRKILELCGGERDAS